MFNGVPDQFHQFGPSLPFPLSFPLHHGANISPPPPAATTATTATATSTNFPAGCFDLYPPTVLQNHVLQLQQQSFTTRKEKEEATCSSDILSTNMVVVGGVDSDERSMSEYPWSNDEVLALLKIRSGLENWFSEFTWEHVSRKLAELGYQRSAEKCKEKFEEESRQFNDMSYNYRFFSEQHELYHAEIPQITTEKNPNSQEQNGGEEKQEEEEEEVKKNCDSEADAGKLASPAAANPFEENNEVVEKPIKKRKRKNSDDEFEIFMGFCTSVVKRLIAKQEEMHNKLIEDIVKREEESIAREEAWRSQEISKINKEIELRAQEKATAAEKQAKVIDLLKKFIPFDSLEDQSLIKRIEDLFMSTQSSNSPTNSSCQVLPNNNPNLPTSSCKTPSPQIQGSPHVGINAHGTSSQNTEEVHDIVPFVSTPISASKISQLQIESAGEKDTGKRWPRDEVLALINIRCKLNNNNNEDKELAAAAKHGPLWERISQGMMELGYKRSAKRCKEKWENINKYFRKTKDNKKKRSEDSRTCPYFQQLNSLYSQGTLPAHSDAPENC